MLQSRLHFRIHSAQTEMRAKNKQAKKGSSSSQNIDDNEDISEIMPPIQASANNFEIPVNEDEAVKALKVQTR